MPIIAHQPQFLTWPGQRFLVRLNSVAADLQLDHEACLEIIEDQLIFIESLQLISLHGWVLSPNALYLYLGLEQSELQQAVSLFKSRSTRLINYDLGIQGNVWEHQGHYELGSEMSHGEFQQWVQTQEPRQRVSWLKQQSYAKA